MDEQRFNKARTKEGKIRAINFLFLFCLFLNAPPQHTFAFLIKGPSIKDVCSQEGRSLSRADKEEGVLQMQTSALFGTKTSDFSKFMVCPHRQEGKGGASADI